MTGVTYRQMVRRARLELSDLGITLRVAPSGEWRVNHRYGAESTAYYTEQLDDALHTGRDMAARRNAQKLQHRAANGTRQRSRRSLHCR
jgi:hypothetical protein